MTKITLIKHDRHGIKQYALTNPIIKTKFFILIIGILLSALGIGFGIGTLLTSKQSKHPIIAQLQQRVTESQIALDNYKTSVQNDLDAMSLQMGRLMAQSTRLNALGNRLTVASNINPNEFNLTSEPGLGGVDPDSIEDNNTVQDIYQHLFNLENTFIEQQQQLSILSQLLDEENNHAQSTPHIKPLKGGWISSRYGKRIDPFTGQKNNHLGMDLSGKYHAEIVAAANGIVIWSGKRGNYGLMVEIDHGNGYTTRYAHAEKLKVQLGQRVNAGEIIAIMGKTGRATSEHLHFEVLKNGHKIDPMPFVLS